MKDMNIRCSKCLISKTKESFFRNAKKKNKLSSWCKKCSYQLKDAWIKRNPQWVENYKVKKRIIDREYQKERRKIKGLKTKESRVYKHKYPEKVSAHSKLNYAIKRGRIKRLPCEVCGMSGKYKVHAHHDDYSRQLVVRWLCVIHHKQVHK